MEGRERLLEDLNDPQREAVTHGEGPLLVLAGAGSGKTRVITRRVAYIIEARGVPVEAIMAVTFTNKAAREMQGRIESLLGGRTQGLAIGTFHALSARLLRREAPRLGLVRQFVIYDEEDSRRLVAQILREVGGETSGLSTAAIRARISHAKNRLESPRQVLEASRRGVEEMVAEVYARYETQLRSAHALDFDDLLVFPIRLFQAHPEVLTSYQGRFRHILVDEYQDTNHAQYRLVQLLAGQRGNLCVVGDDDQSIYGWRGADVGNILRFEEDFPGAKVLRLEENYRSTQTVLDAAHAVVERNRGRRAKRLWTRNSTGEPLGVIVARDRRDEARQVVARLRREGWPLGETLLLYRINAQSRALEEALIDAGVPYTLVGGVRFFERREVKDALAYFRILSNPADELSLRRAMTFPRRGVGEGSLTTVGEFAVQNGLTLYEALPKAGEVPGLRSDIAERMEEFYDLMEGYRERKEELPLPDLADNLLVEVRFIEALREEGDPQSEERAENVLELLGAMREYTRDEGASLEGFLEEVALIADIDRYEASLEAVTLMTVHSAKGLEFDYVFVVGMEEGLFPIHRAFEDPPAMEEERRLFYVGLTRARKQVVLSYARRGGGTSALTRGGMPSRFLTEIPAELLEAPLLGAWPELEGEVLQAWSGDETGFTPERAPVLELEYSQEFPFRRGERVRHGTFGPGTVTGLSGWGNDLKVKVRFDRGGEKKLVFRFANLEREGSEGG